MIQATSLTPPLWASSLAPPPPLCLQLRRCALDPHPRFIGRTGIDPFTVRQSMRISSMTPRNGPSLGRGRGEALSAWLSAASPLDRLQVPVTPP